MEWWQIVIAIVFNVPWLYAFFACVIVPIINDKKKENEFWRKKREWDKAHPDRTRILCIRCRYCKKTASRTFKSWGPTFYPEYCRLLKKGLQGGPLDSYTTSVRCIIPEPSEQFLERPGCENVIPQFTVYFTFNSARYHSSEKCTHLKRASTIYSAENWELSDLYGRQPCATCCVIKENKVYPKDSFLC